MTTYAYPIRLYKHTFEALELLLTKINQEWEREGYPTYNTETGRPVGTFANILEIMKEAKQAAIQNEGDSPLAITFTLTDYLFIPLENLLKEKCQQYKDRTGSDPFDPITGEPQYECASMLEATRLAIKSMSLNSYSTFADGGETIKLWSPKKDN
jgi:hypothetical protein